jgi:TonB-dependent receptor
VPFVGFYDDPNTPPNEGDLTDPSLWNFAELYDNGALDKGDAFTWTLDGDMEVEWGWINTFSFGVRYDDRSAEENSYFGPDRHCAAVATCAGLTQADFTGLMGITDNHFDGQDTVLTEWAIPTESGLLSNQEAMRSAWGYPAGNAKVWENEFSIDEKKTSVYVQADFSTETESGFVDGRIGFRWLDQQTDMSFLDPVGQIASADNSNTVVLPSLMVRWGITEDLIARFGYTETFNLPTFGQLNPYIAYNPDVTSIGYGTASGGNAGLEPIDSGNLDISLEWYFAPGSVVYATYFVRDISNAIVDYLNVVQYDDPDDDPDRGLYDYVLSQPDNAGDSKLNGWEFGATWFPELDGWWDGLGIQASITTLDSEREIPRLNDDGTLDRIDVLDIHGVSDLSYSAILAYDRDYFSARLSWFWRDDFLDRDEARFFANPLGIYKSAEESLDFQATWHVNDNFTLTFDAVNLTDPVFHENYGDNPLIFNFYNNYFSRTFALGVRYQY